MKRFWEIDFLRGTAVIMMVASNLVTDLVFFKACSPSTFWFWFARITAFLFVFLAGSSLYLSYSKAVLEKSQSQLFKKFFKRSAKIFSWGLIITIVTWLFIPNGFVVFGVLHLIGVSILLGFFLLHNSIALAALPLGVAFITLGVCLQSFSFDFPWLVWLGFIPKGFYSVDYFPLLPWFGVFSLGIFFASQLYPKRKRKFKLKDFSYCPIVKTLCFFGRNSLAIYLLHQPALITLLFAVGIAKPLF